MLSAEQIFGFLLAATVITLAPGPDNMMVLSLGMAKGRRPGIAFGLGCALGCLSHTLLAVIGVSALIAASPGAFTALKVGGGLYLVWLGVHALRPAHGAMAGKASDTPPAPRNLFVKGMMANAVNPKVILFFLSFLPQFVIPGKGSVATQMAWLGLLFTGQAAVIFSLLGYFAGTVGQWMHTRPRLGRAIDRLSGLIFVGLGLRLIVGH
ncbi:MAG: LysE family translocator [Azonexus sp.]